jgi:hypothetical protein
MDPEIKMYRIIHWDFDDIFATNPREGAKQRNRIIGDRLIFLSAGVTWKISKCIFP